MQPYEDFYIPLLLAKLFYLYLRLFIIVSDNLLNFTHAALDCPKA